MTDDFPRVRMESRYDGIPPMTDAERDYHDRKTDKCVYVPEPPTAELSAAIEPQPAPVTVDPALVDQLVRWGGMTKSAAVEALLKGSCDVV